MLFRLFFTLLSLFIIQGCMSLETLQSEPWLKSESDNFTLYSKLDTAESESILGSLETFRGIVEQANSNDREGAFPTEIYVMNQTEAALFGISRSVGGYFSNQLDKNIIYLQYSRNIDEMISTILHEYVHYVHAERETSFPRWLEEGTAEYLSGVEVKQEQLILGSVQKHRIDWLRHERWLSADKIIMPGDMSDWGGTKLSMFYAQSWFLTFYLNNRNLPEGQTYSKQFNVYLNSLQSGKDNNIAFEEAFGIKVVKVNDTLMTYWRRGKFNKLTINKEKYLQNITIESRTLTQGESNLMLGEFAASSQETTQSLFFFEKATHFPAQKSSALIGQANAYIYDGQLDKATSLLKMLDNNTVKSSELYFTKALLNQSLAQEAEQSSLQVGFAKKALNNLVAAWKWDKENASIYYHHGLISITYGIEIDQAVSMLEEAIYLNPSHIELKLMLLKVKILTGDKQSGAYARQLLASFNSEYHLYAVDELKALISLTSDYQKYIDERKYMGWAVSANDSAGYGSVFGSSYGYAYGYSNQDKADEAALSYCLSAASEGYECQIIDQQNGISPVFKEWFKDRILN